MPTHTEPILYAKFRGKLIPFDIQKAFEGAPVVTRRGFEVTGLRRIGNQLHGVVDGEITDWNLNGIWSAAPGFLDLFIGIPAKVTFLTRLADWLETFFLGSRRTA